ncbi:MAG: site-specific integrase [Candidatus Thermoplasmatota archaeon]|nr:site-specific integrase [Candidatus Thermoplasmatota archaeon]
MKLFFNDFLNTDSEKYVNSKRDFKKDILEYNKKLINGSRISNHRKAKEYAPLSIKQHISTIKGYLEEHEIIFSPRFWKSLNTTGKGNQTVLEDRIPTRKELDKILTHATARERAFFLTMLSTGLRAKELCLLDIERFNLNSNPVKIDIPAKISKTKKKRYTFCSVEERDALLEWKKIRDNYINQKKFKGEGLFNYLEKEYGKHVEVNDDNRMFPYTPTTCGIWWNRLLNKSGYNIIDSDTDFHVLHLYTLRKFFNTHMKNNCNNLMVEMWMGHKIPYDYEKWTLEEHKQEYLKGMEELLVYRKPANIEEIDRLKQKERQIDDMQAQIVRLNEGMESVRKFFDGSPFEMHKDGKIIKKGVIRTEIEKKSKS